MRIGIDARELCGRPTGVGRYLSGLLHAWSVSPRARSHEFVLYAPEPLVVALDAHRFPTRLLAGPPGTWWEQVRLPMATSRDHLDLLFCPGYSIPLFRRLNAVVTIHDVSFSAHPEWFGVREGFRRRWVTAHSASQARAIITVSQFSQREIVERLGVPASKVHVVPSGITRPAMVLSPIDSGARVLYAGSIFNRRRVPLLIQAFKALAEVHPHVTLDLVGDNRSYPFEDVRSLVSRLSLDDRVRWREYVSDEELGRLYKGARAFAFLSEYEGFGLPPLEALAAGVPVVMLDTEIAREICGDAALYVRAHDLAAVTRALELVLFDDRTRQRLLSAGQTVLARYDWVQAADATLLVLEQVG